MKLSENIKPLSYPKAHAAKTTENLKATCQPIEISQHGEAGMVIQSVADYEQTSETSVLLKMLAQSRHAVADGRTVTSAKVFSQMRQRRGLHSVKKRMSHLASSPYLGEGWGEGIKTDILFLTASNMKSSIILMDLSLPSMALANRSRRV